MSTKDYSSKQEHLIASSLGWRVVSGSGSRAFHVGDVWSDTWLGECKTHIDPGHTIVFNQSVWKKIRDEAMAKGRYPILFVDDGSQSIDHTWCMIPSYTLPNMAFFLHHLRVHNYPYDVRKNISFKSDALQVELKKLHEPSEAEFGDVFSVILGCPCYICRFDVFQYFCELMGW